MGNEASMPCASGRGDPGCSGLLDCQSTRAPIPLNRQPPENQAPTRGMNRLGGIQPGAATFTMVGGATPPVREPVEGRENNYDNGLAKYQDARYGRTAFQTGGPLDRDMRGESSPAPISRPVMDLQEQRRKQNQQSAEDLAEQRRRQTEQAQQALQQVQAQQQAQREQMLREREQMELQQMRRHEMLQERQQQEERQRKEDQRQQHYQRPPSEPEFTPEPHWVRKVHELSKISPLFPLTMAPPADNDFFLYPHLDYENKRDPQQRRPMMPRQPGAVDRRKTAAEEHEEMVVALRDAMAFGTIKLTQTVGTQPPRSSGMATPTKRSTSARSGYESPLANGQRTPYSSADTQRTGAESPSMKMYNSVQPARPPCA